MGVAMFVAVFVGMYYFWRMGREEHWEEESLFDVYFLGLLSFFFFGRLGYVLFASELNGLWESLSLLVKPGLNYGVGVVAAAVVMYLAGVRKEWERWKLFDTLAVTSLLVVAIGAVGNLLNRGRLVLDLTTLVWAWASWGVVTMVRKNFRFYQWYKGEASVAKDGLAALISLGLVGLWFVLTGVISKNWWGLSGLLLIALAGVLTYLRSGRKIEVIRLNKKIIKKKSKKRSK